LTVRNDDEPDPRDEDADLRQAFAALRREDAEKAPPFADLLADAPAEVGHRGRRLRWGVGGLLVAASLLAAVIVRVAARRPEPTPAPMASVQQWAAPTAFLLKTPGHEILETVPRIGSRPPLALPEGEAPSRPLPKRRSVSP
jgi:hypothetical protein